MGPDNWISILIPFLSGIAGVGVAWGVTKASMEDYDRRISKIEEKIDYQVGINRCDQMRETCKEDLRVLLMEIKAEVVANRNWVIQQFQEIIRFMGKMDGSDHRV